MVTAIDGAEGVSVGGERISTRTVLWAAGRGGIPGSVVPWACRSTASGEFRSPPICRSPDHPDVFVVGDLACVVQEGAQVPAVAPAAVQEARHAAQNVLRSLRGEPTSPFRYRDKGSLATIGRTAAVADLGGIKLSGPAAWLAWLFLHLFFLVGFKNRVMVLFFNGRGRSCRTIVARGSSRALSVVRRIPRAPESMRPTSPRRRSARDRRSRAVGLARDDLAARAPPHLDHGAVGPVRDEVADLLASDSLDKLELVPGPSVARPPASATRHRRLTARDRQWLRSWRWLHRGRHGASSWRRASTAHVERSARSP